MTADTNSPLLGLLLQSTGNNSNAWGQNLNDQVITLLENAIAGISTVTVTGGSYALSAAEARSATIFLNGTLTADQTIVVPNTNKKWSFVNATNGGFYVVLKTSTGTNIVSLPNRKYVDVVGIFGEINRLDQHEVGELFYHAGTTAPNGSLECNNAAFKRASVPSLFAIIGTTWGSNDVTDFKVPPGTDTGRFIRSRTGSVAVGTLQSNQNKSHTHTGSGTTAGQSATHTHTGSGTTSVQSVDHTHTGSGTTSNPSVDHTHNGSGTTGGESATHTHTGTTSGASVGHTHTGSGTTSAMSANAAHTHALGSAQSAFLVSVQNGGGTPQGNLVCTSASVSAALTTSSTNTDHTHTYSFTTSDVSADHTHTFTSGTESSSHTHTYSFTTNGASTNHTHTYSFTTSGASVDHTHTYSFTTSAGSADHTHTYSFTTSTGSADGTEARPESLVGILCIRY